MSEPRVLFYLESLPTKEAHTFVEILVLLQRQDSVSFRVLIDSPDSPLGRLLTENKITFDVLGIPKLQIKTLLYYLPYIRKLLRYFQMYPFEVVHALGFLPALLSIILKIRFSVPLIWTSSQCSHFKLMNFLRSVFCDTVYEFNSEQNTQDLYKAA